MPFTSPRRGTLLAFSTLALVACQQDVSGPLPTLRPTAPSRSLTPSAPLVTYNFQNANDGDAQAAPSSINTAIVTATPVTSVGGTGVTPFGATVANFGGDHIFKFLSGVYEYVDPSNYNAFQVGLKSAVGAGCQVNLTQVRFELEQNVVNGGQPIAGVVERRDANGVLLATYPTSILSGFAISNPPRYTTVNLSGATLGSEVTYFRFRMNQDISATSSAYTAQLFLDDLSFDGSVYCAPTAQITAPATSVEGQSVAIAVTTTNATTIAWDLGDGTTGTGALPATHTYADNGTYVISVTLDGAATPTATHTITVSNAAPVVSAFAGSTILVGETYTATGTFSDPGADTYTATVSYGGAAESLALAGSAFSLSHKYSTAGTYTVTVAVTDDDAGVGTSSATVTVLSPTQGAQSLIGTISTMVSGSLVDSKDAAGLSGMIATAQKSMEGGNTQAATGQLGAFSNKVRALQNSGRISASTAATLLSASDALAQSLQS